MRARKIFLLLLTVAAIIGLLALGFSTPHQADAVKVSDIVITQDLAAGIDTREFDQSSHQVTRIDIGKLILFDGESGATLDTIVDELESPVIIAVCHTVNSCLKARLTLEPLAQDDDQERFAVAILESLNGDGKDVSEIITYVFGMKDCGLDMGAREYTSTSLLTAARRWYDGIEKQCLSKATSTLP